MLIAGLVNLCMFLLMTGKNPLGVRGDELVVFCEMFIGGAILLPLDAFALGWVGMSMALKKRGHHRAIYATFARVMLPPWLAIMLFIFLGIGGMPMRSGDMIGFIALWLFGSAIVDLVQAGTARVGLAGLLRERSVQPNILIPRSVLPAPTAEVALR